MTKLCTVNVKFDDAKKLDIYKMGESGLREYRVKAVKTKLDMEPDYFYLSSDKLREVLFEPQINKDNKIEGPFISLNNKATTLAMLNLLL